MSNPPIEELVEAALSLLPPKHAEEVVHDVFETIEKDAALLHEYKALCERYKTSGLSAPAKSIRQSLLGS